MQWPWCFPWFAIAAHRLSVPPFVLGMLMSVGLLMVYLGAAVTLLNTDLALAENRRFFFGHAVFFALVCGYVIGFALFHIHGSFG